MDEEGLATAWGSAVAEALDYAPDSYADDSARALDALASSAQGEPGRNFSGTSTEDWEDAAGVATEAYGGSSGKFTNRQWATLAATHIPLLVLWTFAIAILALLARSTSLNFPFATCTSALPTAPHTSKASSMP